MSAIPFNPKGLNLPPRWSIIQQLSAACISLHFNESVSCWCLSLSAFSFLVFCCCCCFPTRVACASGGFSALITRRLSTSRDWQRKTCRNHQSIHLFMPLQEFGVKISKQVLLAAHVKVFGRKKEEDSTQKKSYNVAQWFVSLPQSKKVEGLIPGFLLYCVEFWRFIEEQPEKASCVCAFRL